MTPNNAPAQIAAASTIPALFEARCDLNADKLAYKVHIGGGWKDVSWDQMRQSVHEVAAGLLSLNIQPGQRVAIIGETRPEWGICDLGALSVGAVTVGLYQTSTPQQWAHILNDSGASVVFVDHAQRLEGVRLVREQLPQLEHVVVWSAPGSLQQDKGELSLFELGKLARSLEGAQEAIKARTEAIDPQSAANFVYTSGTTGPPKGAMLSHANVMALLNQPRTLPLLPDDITYSFLPMCHVAEKVLSFYGRSYTGIATSYARSLDFAQIMEDLAQIRPTIFGSVPRIFEKVYARAQARAQSRSAVAGRIFAWSADVSRRWSRAQRAGGAPSRRLAIQHKLADRLVYQKLRAVFGGRVRYFLSGAAPINPELLEFFHGAGMLVLEAYGMTESTAISTSNHPDDFRFGSVGRPLEDLELKLAEDGEILVRGKTVFLGYHNKPEATAEAIDAEGWLHTGDIGTIDADGYVSIVDRKKNIIITAGGKNIAPQNIENLIKDDPYISNCVVIGDRRPYLTAIVTLDEDEVVGLCELLQIPIRSVEVLAASPQVKAHVQAAVDRANAQLGKVEQIGHFALLDRDLSIDAGELTPTLKTRRQQVTRIHQALIESMYDQPQE